MATTDHPRRTRIEQGIYQRPDGKLEIGFRDAQGVKRWRKVDGGITVARRQLTAEVAKRDRGERTTADPRVTLDRAAELWWQARVVKLRPNTQASYAYALGALRPRFGRHKLTAIGPTELAAWVASAQADGFAARTVQQQLSVLSAIFTYAARHLGFAGTNPVSLLDRVERPQGDDTEKRILTTDELAVVVAGGLIFELAAETGMRQGEILGLAWGDVDLEAQTIAVRFQLQRATVERVPLKTGRSRRTIEATPQLVAKLRAHKLASPPGEFVFATRTGTPIGHRNIRRSFDRLVVDMPAPKPTFHSLRHTHVSQLIAAGWDVAEIATRIGDTIETLMGTYAHEFDSAKRSADRRDRLAELYGTAMEPQHGSSGQQAAVAVGGEVPSLGQIRAARSTRK